MNIKFYKHNLYITTEKYIFNELLFQQQKLDSHQKTAAHIA